MGDLDRRLYTSPHAPTDTVARVGHVAESSVTEFIEILNY